MWCTFSTWNSGLELRLLPGKIYVFDRAYNDFDFWEKIINAKSDFVTRLKDCERNRKLLAQVLKKFPGKNGVMYDGSYESTVPANREKGLNLRHIIYRDAGKSALLLGQESRDHGGHGPVLNY